MPNWCENDLTISGKKDRVLELIEFVKSESRAFDFDNIVPFPKGMAELTTGWCKIDEIERDWFVLNWGTKWNAYKVDEPVVRDLDSESTHAEYHFDTAWSPPEPVINALIHSFPDLDIVLEYFEGGAGYCGGLRYNGWDEDIGQDEEATDIDTWEGTYHGSRGG